MSKHFHPLPKEDALNLGYGSMFAWIIVSIGVLVAFGHVGFGYWLMGSGVGFGYLIWWSYKPKTKEDVQKYCKHIEWKFQGTETICGKCGINQKDVNDG